MKENVGVWSNNFYDLPVLLGEVLVKYLDDNIGDDLYNSMESIASQYTPERSEEQITEIYGNLVEEKKKTFQSVIEPENKSE